jgi:hypothetical protein
MERFLTKQGYMKKILFVLTLLAGLAAKAQETPAAPAVDTAIEKGRITVYKDARLNILASKQGGGPTGPGGVPLGARSAKGYRLMIINTNDRDLALRVRSQLLQRFPEQKVYMSFKPPYIQLKFGNFVEKGEADRYRNNIKRSGIVSTNIYAVPEIVEVKPPKEGEKDPKEAKDK